ncbi:MAG: hypothetical protein KME35_17705 [Aphanocapsa sp. GSE-SYN-MK-11-07L]|jgi:hypothetical protein|nr:hypothetical protein [Aphanocapsa sp. GSE-SYN-MK-11-07L]
MNQQELEAILQDAFRACELAGLPLNTTQQEILLHRLESSFFKDLADAENPLDALSAAERQALIEYVTRCDQNNLDWKAQLLNNWLQGLPSGDVQFIRDRCGLQWLEQVRPVHLAAYADDQAVRVKLGDRLEVASSLWEWVPEAQSDGQEWYGCTVIRVFDDSEAEASYPGCTVRMANGLEYDIHGMYEWNRGNWRWNQS